MYLGEFAEVNRDNEPIIAEPNYNIFDAYYGKVGPLNGKLYYIKAYTSFSFKDNSRRGMKVFHSGPISESSFQTCVQMNEGNFDDYQLEIAQKYFNKIKKLLEQKYNRKLHSRKKKNNSIYWKDYFRFNSMEASMALDNFIVILTLDDYSAVYNHSGGFRCSLGVSIEYFHKDYKKGIEEANKTIQQQKVDQKLNEDMQGL